MYHKHKDQIEALGGVGNHLKESRGHKILAQKIQQIAIRKKIADAAIARHNAEQEKAEKEKNLVPMESVLRDKEDLQAKRKTLQDFSMNKDVDQRVVQQRKLDLEKEAKKRGMTAEGGAGEFGTSELTKKYAKDTPGQCQEILNMNTSDMGDVIKDFKKSDAPQFKGKSIEKRRQMAIAAKLSSQDKE